MARRRRASSSSTALAAVMAPMSAWPATTSATASSAVSNTRISAAPASPPACRTTLATATWLELPSEVESAIRTLRASRAKHRMRSVPLRIAASARTTKAMYSEYRIASGTKRAGSMRSPHQVIRKHVGRADPDDVAIAGEAFHMAPRLSSALAAHIDHAHGDVEEPLGDDRVLQRPRRAVETAPRRRAGDDLNGPLRLPRHGLPRRL